MKHILCAVLMTATFSVPCLGQFQGGAQEISPTAPTIDAQLLNGLLHAVPPVVTFQPDDVISVQVYGLENYALQQMVSADGTILFPFIGKVQVAGLSVEELEISLQDLLKKDGVLADPQVTVSVVAQPSVIATVSGDVVKPGTFPAYGKMTLMDYISKAGGFVDILVGNAPTNAPASSTVVLVRPSLKEPITIPLGPDPMRSLWGRIPIFPGDEIRVGKTGYVYAFGAFKFQGVFPLKNTSPTTVLQLSAMAGGIGFEADRGDACVIRTAGTSKYVLNVNVANILKGKSPDVALQPDDILFVPTNEMKAAIKGGGSGALVSLASAYIYTQH